MALLNLTPLSRKQDHKSLLKHLLNTVQACIPRMRKQQSAPTVAQWLAGVNLIEQMENLTSALQDKSEEHKTRWFCWDLFHLSNEFLQYS